jgi:hypothetical protein
MDATHWRTTATSIAGGSFRSETHPLNLRKEAGHRFAEMAHLNLRQILPMLAPNLLFHFSPPIAARLTLVLLLETITVKIHQWMDKKAQEALHHLTLSLKSLRSLVVTISLNSDPLWPKSRCLLRNKEFALLQVSLLTSLIF